LTVSARARAVHGIAPVRLDLQAVCPFLKVAPPRRWPRLDEVHFIRGWLERPLATGAVTPSGRVLARTMARYIEPAAVGHIIELGPGTGRGRAPVR
jgi:hypothetical protein